MAILAKLLVTILVNASPSHGEDLFRIDVHAGQKHAVPGEIVVLFTHPSYFYDRNERSRQGVLAVNDWAKVHGAYRVLLFSGALDTPNYFLTSADVDLTTASGAGQHSLLFPKAKEVISAGGHFGLCLCESLRDVMAGTVEPGLRIRVVTDATYDSVSSSLASKDHQVKSFMSPWERQDSLSLEDLRRQVGDQKFLLFARDRILDDTVLCPHQGFRLRLDNIQLTLRAGEETLQAGEGQHQIHLDFVTSQELRK